MTTDIFCFYLQNRLIQTSQTGGQQYSDASPFSIPWRKYLLMKIDVVEPSPHHAKVEGYSPATIASRKRERERKKRFCKEICMCIWLDIFVNNFGVR
jgi:hypothetical protein